MESGQPTVLAFHGAGNGILTIAKGTLPLVLFGPQGYGARLGLLMEMRPGFHVAAHPFFIGSQQHQRREGDRAKAARKPQGPGAPSVVGIASARRAQSSSRSG